VRLGYIYTLSDPRTQEIRYVGQTINSPSKRLSQHIHQESRVVGKLTHVNSWIRNLKQNNFKPILAVVEECPIEELNSREIYYISEYKQVHNLCNHSLGGQGRGGCKFTKESVEKRNKTILTSEKWANKCKEHSVIMKSLYASGNHNFGYGHISKEKRIEIGHKHSLTMKEIYKNNPEKVKTLISSILIPVCLLNSERQIIKVYKSAAAAARDCNIKASTHVTRVCKNRSKSTHGLMFAYLKYALF
jgi:hypothetical protein